MKAHYKKPAHGFALIEALVAMMVVSFGMLAIAGFQTTLSLNADVSKQRTEATRLAQQKMEELRTFENLAIYGTQMVSSSAVTPVTQETITSIAGTATNATFTRSWAITSASAPDTGRSVVVTVAWTDRAGNAQQVQLTSHVSATDPLLTGSLWFPLPDGTILRRPKNRSIDIPVPAISIPGTGKSRIPWTGTSGGYLVFSDNTGDVELKCTTTPTSEADLKNTSICTKDERYLLTGYISGSQFAKVTKIEFSSVQYITGTPECTVGDALDQNTGTKIANYKYYACLIYPTDHDTKATTARVWSGRVDLAGDTSTSLTDPPGTQVCRFSVTTPVIQLPTGIEPTLPYNNNHPETYVRVDRSLDNQNFSIIEKSDKIKTIDCVAGSVLHATY